MIRVLGIKITDRIKEAGLTQSILSRHSSVITTRLGFHEVTDSLCSREAYIVLHLKDDRDEADALKNDLNSIGGIELREMNFTPGSEKSDGRPGEKVEIMGILVEQSPGVISSVQKVLTSFGCNIRTRLGVNESFFGQPAGLIILELTGDQEQIILLEKDLKALKNVHVRVMTF